MLVHTYSELSDPHRAALRFSTVLATDKGVSNQVTGQGGVWRVTADDGRYVEFRGVVPVLGRLRK